MNACRRQRGLEDGFETAEPRIPAATDEQVHAEVTGGAIGHARALAGELDRLLVLRAGRHDDGDRGVLGGRAGRVAARARIAEEPAATLAPLAEVLDKERALRLLLAALAGAHGANVDRGGIGRAPSRAVVTRDAALDRERARDAARGVLVGELEGECEVRVLEEARE